MRDMRDRRIREDERRIARKEINRERRSTRKAEKQQVTLEQQRQEEARMRQAAEQSNEILIRQLHAQGASIKSIASAMSKSTAFVKKIIDKK